MGATLPSAMSTESFLRQHMTVHQGKGLGYAASTSAELDFVTDFALETGIVLDPVYSGKGLYHFMTHVLEQDPEKYRGTNILFWHTGTSRPTYAIPRSPLDLFIPLKSITPHTLFFVPLFLSTLHRRCCWTVR
jgi:hypothetical protein